MARPLRFQYPGAIYHLMARGDGGKAVFEDDADCKGLVFRLGKVCESHGWRVHAWVLMSNHFHLLVETPEANLVSGMKLLLGAFSQGWNRRRQRRGHVFQGRYKAIPVNTSDASPYYFRIVADYIHLNPARAELVGAAKGSLLGYPWSSLPCYSRGNGPDWLEMERLLRAFHLAGDGRGRRAYVAWLETRAANHGGRIDAEAMRSLRRGWYLGEPSFRDRLLGMLESTARELNQRGSRTGQPVREHGEREAERLLHVILPELGLPERAEELRQLRPGDQRKVLAAVLLRNRTTVDHPWISRRLAMGHPGSVSRLAAACSKDAKRLAEVGRLEELLKSAD